MEGIGAVGEFISLELQGDIGSHIVRVFYKCKMSQKKVLGGKYQQEQYPESDFFAKYCYIWRKFSGYNRNKKIHCAKVCAFFQNLKTFR